MDMTNLNADDTAALRCHIKDLEIQLYWSLRMWSATLDQLEELAPDDKGVRLSRDVIKETREKWLQGHSK